MPALSVGVATVDITPPVGCEMGGYAARKGRAESIAAPLRCRAFVFDDARSQLALVICDLLFVTRDISALARRLIEEESGIPPHCVMVTGTHTHSGPAGLTMGLDPVFAESVSRKIAGSVAEALLGKQPARLKYAETGVTTISQNRRDPDGPIETTVRLLIADADGDPRPIATIVNYACHATVLEYDNLALSPDFPGEVAASLEQNVGGQAAYLQGCAGSINPVWMRHDHAEARRIGNILGLAASRVVLEALPVGRGQWSVNLSLAEDVVKPGPANCAVVSAAPLSAAAVTVKLSRRARPPLERSEAELSELEADLNRSTDPVERRTLLARRAAVRMEAYFGRRPDRYSLRQDVEERSAGEAGDTEEVEVQALRLGHDTVIIGLPGEPFLEIGEEIRERSPVHNVLVAGYANEAIGYVPVATEFVRHGYEVGCARFTPEAARALVEGALAAISATSR
jgi:neutral ceramidase